MIYHFAWMRAFLVTAIAVGIGMWLATLGGQGGSDTDWIGSVFGTVVIVVAIAAYLRYLALRRRGRY